MVSVDEMAAGMMSVFRRAGVRIPDDLALIGVDDHPVADLVHLTTIAGPAAHSFTAFLVASTAALAVSFTLTYFFG